MANLKTIQSLQNRLLQNLKTPPAQAALRKAPTFLASSTTQPPERERRRRLSEEEKQEMLLMASELGAEAQKGHTNAVARKDVALFSNTNFMDMRALICRLSGTAEENLVKLRNKTEGLQNSMNSLRDQIAASEDLIHARAEVLRKKNKKAKKWVWVPFYNLHLLLDADSQYKSHVKVRDKLLDEIRRVEDEYFEVANMLHRAEMAGVNNQRIIEFLEQQARLLIGLVNSYSEAVGKWNDVINCYAELMVKIDTSDLIDVGAIEDMFSNIERTVSELLHHAKMSIGVTYAGKFSIQNVRSGLYVGEDSRLRTSPQVFTFAPILGRDVESYFIISEKGHFAKIVDSQSVTKRATQEFDLIFTDFDRIDTPYFWEIRQTNDGLTLGGWYVWDVKGGNFAKEAIVWCYAPNGTPAQSFRLVPA